MNAQEAVGRDDPSHDWILRPEEHAEALPPEAGPLKRILTSDTARQLIRDYREADRAAIKARARYVTLGQWLIIASAAAIMLGAVYLLTGAIIDGQNAGGVRTAIGDGGMESWLRSSILGLEVLAFVLIVVLAIWMREDRPFEEWMRFRARAETNRLSLFQAICGL